MPLPKFKVGDTVICIGKESPQNAGKGAGWKKDFIFTITSITNSCGSCIYWKGYKGNGVLEDYLQLKNTAKYSKNSIIIDKNNEEGTITKIVDSKIYIKYNKTPYLELYVEEEFIEKVIKKGD